MGPQAHPGLEPTDAADVEDLRRYGLSTRSLGGGSEASLATPIRGCAGFAGAAV